MESSGRASPLKRAWVRVNSWSLHVKLAVLMLGTFVPLLIFNYFVYSSTMRSHFETTIAQADAMMLKQAAQNLEAMLSDLARALVPVREEAQSNVSMSILPADARASTEVYIHYEQLFNQLTATGENYRFVDSMLVLGEDSPTLVFSGDVSIRAMRSASFQDMLSALDGDMLYFWSKSPAKLLSGGEELVSLCTTVTRYRQVQSIVLLNIKQSELVAFMDDLAQGKLNVFLDMGDSGRLFGGDFDERLMRSVQAQSMLASGESALDQSELMMLSETLTINGWRLGLLLPKREMYSGLGDVTKMVSLTFVISIIIALLSILMIAFTITRPIKKLTTIMSRVDKSMDLRFYPRYRDEVGQMAMAYDNMMDKIKGLNEDLYREQQQSKLAYMRMLQMQIKPHFLYNSLEALKFLVERGDPRAVGMVESLGKFYKTSLLGFGTLESPEAEGLISLKDELEHLETYLKILQLRYSSKLDYQFDVEPGILEHQIVRFVLQPLVENAVYHGVKNRRSKGLVKVSGRANGDQIELTVWDNGVGMSKQQLEQLLRDIDRPLEQSESVHIGLRNVKQRLTTFYPRHELIIETQLGEFTRIRMVIPRIEAEDNLL